MYTHFFTKKPLHTLAASLLLVSAALPALAQVPTTVDPGRILDRFDKEPRKTPSSGSIVIEQRGKDVAPGKGSTEKVFTLNRVVLSGSTVYGEEGPKAAYSKWIGQSVSFSDLQTMAAAMTTQYRNDGYILSRVVLKPQKISGGTVYFQAHEGYVDDIQINGTIRGDRDLLNNYASKIKAERPLNAKTLERYILLMDDLPGVTARSVLKASPKQKDASTLVISLNDTMAEGSLQVDNRGNRFIGPYQLSAVGAVNSAFGMYDRNTLRIVSSADFDELLYGDFTNELQLGNEGTRFTTRIAAAHTEPGSTLSSLDLEGNSQAIELGVLHPLIRTREQNLFLNASFRAQHSDNASAGTELFDDQVRHIALGLDYDVTDTWDGINRMGASVTQGLDILGATEDGANRSRITGNHVFTRFNANAARIQDLSNNFSLLGSFSGQVAVDPLLTSEQFAVGGEGYGRAYDGAEILGDSGVAGLLELRYNGSLADQSFLVNYQPYVFYDYGATWLIDTVPGERSDAVINSAGLGTRFNLIEDFAGYVEVSFPINKDVSSENDKGTRVFFNLIKRFDTN